MKKKYMQLILVIACVFWVKTACAQDNQIPATSTGIEMVAKLERPKKAAKFNEKDLAGYLLVYFKDMNQSAYMAISSDGYTFTDVNGGNPVFIGSQLAEQKGIRDPHITRGPDGAFYLAMTNLHIFGKRAGFRDTDWERPAEKYGWGNNRAIVLMKSYDLIHWTHSDFRFDKAFPELGDIDCAWAPEKVFDPVKGKMMVYFTIRYNNIDANMYFSYPDEDFTIDEQINNQTKNKPDEKNFSIRNGWAVQFCILKHSAATGTGKSERRAFARYFRKRVGSI